MKTKVFLDTSWFKGIIDEKDDFHSDAVGALTLLESMQAKMVTTNFIIDETFTLVRKRRGEQKAKELYEWIKNYGKQLKLVRVLAKDEKRVWDWFWKDWSKLSYTDCTSFAVMERLGIARVATFDGHFAEAGFHIV